MNFKNIKSFFSSSEKRALLFLFLGAFFNIGFAAYELFLSFTDTNFWTGAVAVYYMLLSGIKFALLKKEKKLKRFYSLQSFKKESKKVFVFCGILLFILNLIMIIMVLGILFFGNKERTPLQVLVLAIYAVFRVAVALRDIFYYKNAHNYIVSAAKIISLSVALLALFSLELSMLNSLNFKPLFTRIISISSALSLLTAEFSLSAYMISHNNY